MRSKSAPFLVFFLLFSAYAWAAADTEISVKAEVNRAEITIGEPLEYTVQVRHGAGVKVLSRVPPPPEDLFKIKKVEDIDRKEGGQMIEGRKYTLTAFQLGEFVIDPVKIEYRAGEGQPQILETNKIYISVTSVAKGEEKKDIRGLKATIALVQKYGWMIISGVLLALAAAGVVFYLKFRKNPELFLKPAEPPLSPDEEALNALNRLFDSDLMRRGKIKEYYLKLSEILRVYFEKRFQILAIESTTYEILRELTLKEIDRGLLEKIQEVLEWADLAKFAKWVPEPAQVVVINQKAKQIIETARPAPEPAGGI